MAHKFGGIWTQKKLEILEQYLSFYSQALKNQGFCLHYVDAFAGTGSHNPETDDIQSALIPCEDLRGSVVTALTTSPAFHHYHFNDIDPEHIAALGKIRDEYPQCKINLTQLDANDFAPEFCSRLTPNDRAVIFLDPARKGRRGRPPSAHGQGVWTGRAGRRPHRPSHPDIRNRRVECHPLAKRARPQPPPSGMLVRCCSWSSARRPSGR